LSTRPETNTRENNALRNHALFTVKEKSKSIAACLCLLEQGNEQGAVQWVLIVHACVSCSRVEVGMPRHLQSCRHNMDVSHVLAGLVHATMSDSYLYNASFDRAAVPAGHVHYNLLLLICMACQMC